LTYSLGLDIGSSSVKLSLVDASGALIHTDSLGLLGSPRATVDALLARLPAA